jgi:hypothetical protein
MPGGGSEAACEPEKPNGRAFLPQCTVGAQQHERAVLILKGERNTHRDIWEFAADLKYESSLICVMRLALMLL